MWNFNEISLKCHEFLLLSIWIMFQSHSACTRWASRHGVAEVAPVWTSNAKRLGFELWSFFWRNFSLKRRIKMVKMCHFSSFLSHFSCLLKDLRAVFCWLEVLPGRREFSSVNGHVVSGAGAVSQPERPASLSESLLSLFCQSVKVNVFLRNFSNFLWNFFDLSKRWIEFAFAGASRSLGSGALSSAFRAEDWGFVGGPKAFRSFDSVQSDS